MAYTSVDFHEFIKQNKEIETKNENRKYDFIALDCEKANNTQTSICSLGYACFKNGKIVKQKEYLIKPNPCYFYKGIEESKKTTYHGILLEKYREAPTFEKIWPKIEKVLRNEIIVGHGINGDLLLIQTALESYGITYAFPPKENCICTNISSVYVYPECESHKLGMLCEYLNIKIKPHHALSDAKACGELLQHMLNDIGCDTIEQFIFNCNSYNNIILEKYTEKNISRYENEIIKMFNFNLIEIELIKKKLVMNVEDAVSFYKQNKEEKYNLPNINIIPCVSPIIEINKNEKYKKYFDKLKDCTLFSNDAMLFAKNKDGYTLFVGILSDKMEILRSVFAFLSREHVKITGGTKPEYLIRSFIKNYEATNMLINFLQTEEEFEEYEVYKYINFFYEREREIAVTSYYRGRYKDILEHLEQEDTYPLYLNMVKERMKIIAIYTSMKELFPLYASGLKIPNDVFLEYNSNLLVEIYDVLKHKQKNKPIKKISNLLNRWYEKIKQERKKQNW